MKHPLFSILGVNPGDKKALKELCQKLKISQKTLEYYNDLCVLPFEDDLASICSFTGLSEEIIKIRMGIIDEKIKAALSENFEKLVDLFPPSISKTQKRLKASFETELGSLYRGDCIELLKTIESNTFDLIFADPPFNLDKFYLSGMDDNLTMKEYKAWTEEWLEECIRVLKHGGALLLWNLPKWNTYFSEYLNNRLTFRHWIVCDIKFSLPISSRLYPSHYSMLYYIKGDSPNTFHPDRLPMETCNKCYSDLKDYGGYKDKMNPLGINLTDVWLDIPPVRHAKYKRRKEANELSIKLLDRVIEMTTNEGDIVFDPFGGSGTTYAVAEIKNRRWIGVELGPIDSIIDRFSLLHEERGYLNEIRKGYNKLFTEKIRAKRSQLNIWTDQDFSLKESEPKVMV